MKTIKLKSESPLFKDSHFIVTEFLGQETVGFIYSEKEFVNKSVFYGLFDKDFDAIPCEQGKTEEDCYDRHSFGSQNYGKKTFYCPNEFFIVCDKGSKGFKTAMTVFTCQIEDIDDEFVVTISQVEDTETISKATETFNSSAIPVGRFLNEHLTVYLDNFHTDTEKVVTVMEKTVFLDIDDGSKYLKVPVNPSSDERYKLIDMDYKPIGNDSYQSIDEGDFIFKIPVPNAIEILEVEHFAHSVYAKLYAVVKQAYVYPRDKKAIEEKFPEFYMEYCVSAIEREKNRLYKQSDSVPYIPENNQLGDEVIYRKLSFQAKATSIEDDIFQMITAIDGFKGALDNGTEHRLLTGKDDLNASLIQVGDKFKILFYTFLKVVKHKGDYYGKFVYRCESSFFTDFNCANMGNALNKQTYKGIEYLLYRGQIKPIQISKERYEEFKRN